MKSTMKIDVDFESKEPLIQFTLPNTNIHHMVDVDVSLDLADKTLKFFLEEGFSRGIELVHPNGNNDNSMPQIRLKTEVVKTREDTLSGIRQAG